MTEQRKYQLEPQKTPELPPLVGVEKVAQFILKERPNYIIIADVHITAEPQDLAAAILQATVNQPNYKPGELGFYVEALFDTARPEQGDFSGSVINWDEWHKDEPQKNTHYRMAIESAVTNHVPVHGLDLNKKVDSESLERTAHWLAQLAKGKEPIKVLLIGAGHVWNNTKMTSDVLSRIPGKTFVLKNVEAYPPPGFVATANVDFASPQLAKRTYRFDIYESQ